MKKITTLIMTYIVFHTCLWGGRPVWNMPTTITQPNGTIIECLASGHEYYCRLHDEDGYTIIKNRETEYYCYAILEGDELIASEYVVGTVLPKSVNLKPNADLSPEKKRELIENNIMYISTEFGRMCTNYREMLFDTNKERSSETKKKKMLNEMRNMLFHARSGSMKGELSDMIKSHFPDTIIQNMFFDTITYKLSDTIGFNFNTRTLPTPGGVKNIDNIVVFIRFDDQNEFSPEKALYVNMFNSTTSNANSMRSYFLEASYGNMHIMSHFYPRTPGSSNPNIISYQDSQPRGYYCEYSSSNTLGYTNDTDRRNREHTLKH